MMENAKSVCFNTRVSQNIMRKNHSGHFIRSTVMHFYQLIFVILDASRMNEHIFEASKIYENIFNASTLLLKRREHFWTRRVHFGRVAKYPIIFQCCF